MRHTLLSTLAAAAALGASSTVRAQQNASSANPLLLSTPPAEDIDLNLNLTSGGYFNAIYRSNLTAAQVLFTDPSAVSVAQPNRFVVALPAGNSGHVAYWFPVGGNDNATSSATVTNGTTAAAAQTQNLTVTLEEGTLQSAIGPDNLTGVQGTMLFSTSADLGPTQIGATRQVRDYVEGMGLSHEIFNYTVTQLDSSVVWFSRRWLNDTIISLPNGTNTSVRYGYEFRLEAQNGTASFQVQPGNNGTFTPPSVRVVVPDGQVGKIDFTVQTNETSLVPLKKEVLFTEPAMSGVSGETNGTSDGPAIPGFTANDTSVFESQMSFLLYASKATAGGWRFLTYFGRDTIFTLHILKSTKTITPLAIESILGGVIERINITSGYICHEETIGDYATFVNLGNNRSDLGNTPFLDYKMRDTHALLLPQLADYFLLYNGTFNSTTNETAETFLNRTSPFANGTSYRELVDANVQYIMNSSAAFAQQQNYTNLQANEPGIPVGNWRDSNEGIGYGDRAFDVNTALWPAALYAIADLSQAGILDSSLESDARMYAQVWEEKSLPFFESILPADDANYLVNDYIPKANLSSSLLYGLGSLNGTNATEVADSSNSTGVVTASNASPTAVNMTSRDIFSRQETNSSDSNVTVYTSPKTIYGISLRDNGSVVDVLHSDLGFGLVFRRNITQDYVERVIEALEPYPRGLLTNVGMLVANPAFDSNRTNIEVLGRAAYHGTVSWSWQSGMMGIGLTRVLRSCNGASNTTLLSRGLNRPDWCDNSELVSRLEQAHKNLVVAINGAKEEIFGEVWSNTWLPEQGKFEVTALGAISSGTESDAVQLWSFGALNGIVSAANDTVPADEMSTSSTSTTAASTTSATAASTSSMAARRVSRDY